jgi:hypothetical protein
VGSTLVVVSALAERDIFAISRANVPFVLTLVGVLLLVIFVPGVGALWPDGQRSEEGLTDRPIGDLSLFCCTAT